ncbi:MAG: MGMT family protein [Candidatus Omnitrophica bacterium]|nr:MGMT family protein [Candidatus Omnitrophota bacterium]
MTEFSKKVYGVLLDIPPGEVRIYKWVAKKAGRPKAYRAVGTILKHNPWPLILPYHRVIKGNNILGSYIFGTKAKKAIIDLEKELKRCLANKE